jgi:CRISPR-associated protein Cmr2
MTTLILIAVGPVQPFIAAARKIRDLAVGSWLLSELSKAVARSVVAEGCRLIFPAEDADLAEGGDLSVANKILAEVPGTADPQAIGQAAKTAMHTARSKFFADALKRLKSETGPAESGEGTLLNDLFLQQRDATGEFYAVWTPVNADYASARKRVEQLLSARKAARIFNAPDWNGTGLRKCSLDGVWETVLPIPGTAGLREALQRNLLLKDGEHLDALALVKRLPPGNRNNWRFEGLASVAVETWLAGASGRQRWSELNSAYERALPRVSKDPAYYFPMFMEEWLTENPDAEKSAVRTSSKALMEEFGQPEPYGCILCGDGDHMGAALDAIADADGHRRFSSELSKFAGDAGDIVVRFNGQLIYSGGDDVLAFLPLHTAAECALALRESFQQTMAAACPDVIAKPTFSVGIAVVHVKTPLDLSLSLARRAESIAKNKHGRDALCWLWNTRGNSEMAVGGKWNAPWRVRMEHAVVLYRARVLSMRTGYQIRAAARLLSGEDQPLQFDGTVPADPVTSEIIRLLRQKQNSGAAQSLPQRLESMLMLDCDPEVSPGILADTLVIARRFARASAIADGKRPPDETQDD